MKKQVKMEHPFVPGHEVCAKAKWHHAGDGHKQRVDIKGPKDCEYKHGVIDKKYWPIDIIKHTVVAQPSTHTATKTVTLFNSNIPTQPSLTAVTYTSTLA